MIRIGGALLTRMKTLTSGVASRALRYWESALPPEPHYQSLCSCCFSVKSWPRGGRVELFCLILVVQSLSHIWLCSPMDCGMPGFPVLHHLPELAQTYVHWANDAIQPSHPLTTFSFCPQSFSASGSFQMSWLFESGGQSIGVSASASVLLMNIQGWFPLRLADLISLLSEGLSNTTGQKWGLMLLFPRHF